MVKNKKDLFIASLIQFRAFDMAVTLKHNVIFEHKKCTQFTKGRLPATNAFEKCLN